MACGVASLAAPALADTRDDVLAGVARCGVIHDDRIWLDCVYGAQQPMRAKLGLSPAPELQQRLVPGPNVAPPPGALAPARRRGPPAPKPRKKLGFFGTLLNDTPDHGAVRMASYRYEKDGAFVVALENGQEWRQTDVVGGGVSLEQPGFDLSRGDHQGRLRATTNCAPPTIPRIYSVERVR